VLCPLAWLLGQTVPILTNLMQDERTGEASGMALYWSTLGSFLGSVSLSLLVMQWLGVSAAVFACALGLVIGSLLLAKRNENHRFFAVDRSHCRRLQYQHEVTADTAYAEYIVGDVSLSGQQNPRAFWVNKSTASLIDDSEPPNYTRYIKHLRQILLDDLGFKGQGHPGPRRRRLHAVAPRAAQSLHLCRYRPGDPRDCRKALSCTPPFTGEFIADDARRFIATTERRFDAVVVDVYSSHTSIPSHLVTREFWAGTRRA
jgi:hypothetical protein